MRLDHVCNQQCPRPVCPEAQASYQRAEDEARRKFIAEPPVPLFGRLLGAFKRWAWGKVLHEASKGGREDRENHARLCGGPLALCPMHKAETELALADTHLTAIKHPFVADLAEAARRAYRAEAYASDAPSPLPPEKPPERPPVEPDEDVRDLADARSVHSSGPDAAPWQHWCIHRGVCAAPDACAAERACRGERAKALFNLGETSAGCVDGCPGALFGQPYHLTNCPRRL